MPAMTASKDTIRDIMTEQPVTVRPETTMTEILAVMKKHGVSTCPVVKSSGELCGIVSQVDVLRAFRPSRELDLFTLAEVGHQQARDIMRFGVVSLEPDDPLVAALDLLVETRFHTLPVVRRGPDRTVVVGIISQSDVLRHLIQRAPKAAG